MAENSAWQYLGRDNVHLFLILHKNSQTVPSWALDSLAMLSEVCEGEQGMQSRAFPSPLMYKATLMLKNSVCDRVVMKANIHGSNTSEILKSKIPLLGREKNDLK